MQNYIQETTSEEANRLAVKEVHFNGKMGRCDLCGEMGKRFIRFDGNAGCICLKCLIAESAREE